MNTANTAQTDYSNSSQQNSSYNPQDPVAGNGYTSSFSGGNGNNGGYNGYSYSSAPQQPPRKKKKSHGGKKVLLRVPACVGVVALGFGGGLAELWSPAAPALTGNQVVVQQVQRDTSTDAVSHRQHRWHQHDDAGCCRAVSPSVVAITTEQMAAARPGLAATMCRAVPVPASSSARMATS